MAIQRRSQSGHRPRLAPGSAYLISLGSVVAFIGTAELADSSSDPTWKVSEMRGSEALPFPIHKSLFFM